MQSFGFHHGAPRPLAHEGTKPAEAVLRPSKEVMRKLMVFSAKHIPHSVGRLRIARFTHGSECQDIETHQGKTSVKEVSRCEMISLHLQSEPHPVQLLLGRL